jgi:hypothetical protein
VKHRSLRSYPTLILLAVVAILVIIAVLAESGSLAFVQFLLPGPPKYGWLEFGPHAQTRVLVRMDGEAVTLIHYADGKPTGRRERFRHRSECKNVTIPDPDGKTSYVITRMSGTVVRDGLATELFVGVDINGPLSYRQYADLGQLAENPETAPCAFFHGPLAIEVRKANFEIPSALSLKRGGTPTEFFVNIGTFDARKHCWTVVRTHTDENQPEFTREIYPFVDIEFPGKKEGEPSIKRRYALDEFC